MEQWEHRILKERKIFEEWECGIQDTPIVFGEGEVLYTSINTSSSHDFQSYPQVS